jgi:membrane carboxypeptidase/penicillin-binding protein PbpC
MTDNIIIWICIIIVTAIVTVPIAYEAPMFARCTQAALDVLQRADPLDRRPPPALAAAIEDELSSANLPLAAARKTIRVTRCNGRRTHTIAHMFENLGVSLWWRLRFSREDLVGLYASQAWLGYRRKGFAAASRAFFGRELDELTPDEQRCLARKLRTPNARGYTCNSKVPAQAVS